MGRPKGSKNGVYTLVHLICDRCGTPFSRKPSDGAARFCSMNCYKPKAAIVQCETCGESYTLSAAERGRFCSNKCKRRRVAKVCPQCGSTFEVKVSHASKYTYCSLPCRRLAYAWVTVACLHCATSFQVPQARAPSKRYCSQACRLAACRQLMATLTCERCGVERVMPKYRVVGGHFCSNRCATLSRMEQQQFDPGYIGNKRRTGYRTDIEALAEAALKMLGVPYLFEHKVGRFSVDFALPTLGIALECDGWQHLTEKGRARDIWRDAKLIDDGWDVVHIPDRLIRKDALATVRDALTLAKHDLLQALESRSDSGDELR